MFVLLSDGAGLTARQCATLLSAAGHRVEALSPDPLCLSRLTRNVRAVHRVPGLGAADSSMYCRKMYLGMSRAPHER